MYCVVVWQLVIGMFCVLCGGVSACHWYGVYWVVVWQRVIDMVCVLCGGVAACYMYGVCQYLCIKNRLTQQCLLKATNNIITTCFDLL